MALLRLLLFLLAGVFVYRLLRRPRPSRRPGVRPPAGRDEGRLRDLTQQDISDADYEEIP